jgi:2,4-dienoyl-CoA reductase-like NADH-dependent reductase (Old Yellow Enzyme family)
VAEQLGQRKLAFICTREHVADDSISPMLKQHFGGVYIANEAFTAESAEAYVAEGKADAVAFGKPYIANPDLAQRIAAGADWNEQDASTFYASGPEGYTDYPFMPG